MVGTRHSLPSDSADATDDATPSNNMSKKAQAALKKLAIDGKGAMVGEKPQQEAFETYHYRGAVYAVSKGTKPEWIEAEPERYRRRKDKEREKDRSVEVDDVDSGYGRSSEDVASRTGTPVGSARQVRFDSAMADGEGRKRKRSADEEAEVEDVSRRSKRRPRIQTGGARKSAFTLSPPTKLRRPGATSPAVSQTIKGTSNNTRRSLPSLAPPPSANRPPHSAPPANHNDPNAAGWDKLRRTKRDLLTVARMNTQYDRTKARLKQLLLRRRLRDLSHRGGDRAESQIFALQRRGSVDGGDDGEQRAESKSMRERRARREMEAVRNLWALEEEE